MTSKNDVNKVNFWFFRHGYSCFNIYKDKNFTSAMMTYKSQKHRDPHLTNWGILGSIMSGNYVNENKLKDIKFEMAFVSPLIRTWETAACMFAGIVNEFTIGKYLREGKPDDKSQKKIFLNGSSNIPEEYIENLKRFSIFKKFLKNDTDKSFKYISDKLKNTTSIVDKINKIQNVEIKRTNQPDKKYDDPYNLKGDLEMFMLWFANKYPTIKGDVLVVCHGSLILKNFVKKYIDPNEFKEIVDVEHYNNFGFKVSVNFPKRNYSRDEIESKNKPSPIEFGVKNIKLIFNGVHKPKLKEIKIFNDIRRDCSLCTDVIGSCKGAQKQINLNSHLKLLKTSNFFPNMKENNNKKAMTNNGKKMLNYKNSRLKTNILLNNKYRSVNNKGSESGKNNYINETASKNGNIHKNYIETDSETGSKTDSEHKNYIETDSETGSKTDNINKNYSKNGKNYNSGENGNVNETDSETDSEIDSEIDSENGYSGNVNENDSGDINKSVVIHTI